MLAFKREQPRVHPPLSYLAAVEIAETVQRSRNGIAQGRDSDGNVVTIRYEENVVERAARAASSATDREASITEIERVFQEAEERISTKIHTS